MVGGHAIPLFRFTGRDAWQCTWPGEMSSTDYDLLEGKWFQTHATFGTERFGCLWEQIRTDNDGDDSTFFIDVNWTAFQSTLTPLDKGTFTHTYKTKGDSDGLIEYSKSYRPDSTFAKIVSTDYSSYILQYYC